MKKLYKLQEKIVFINNKFQFEGWSYKKEIDTNICLTILAKWYNDVRNREIISIKEDGFYSFVGNKWSEQEIYHLAKNYFNLERILQTLSHYEINYGVQRNHYLASKETLHLLLPNESGFYDWQLNKTLEEQSDKVINKFYDILV